MAGPVTLQNGYIAGLFAADGSISLNINCPATKLKNLVNSHLGTSALSPKLDHKNSLAYKHEIKILRALHGTSPQIHVKISNKTLNNLQGVSTAFAFKAIKPVEHLADKVYYDKLCTKVQSKGAKIPKKVVFISVCLAD